MGCSLQNISRKSSFCLVILKSWGISCSLLVQVNFWDSDLPLGTGYNLSVDLWNKDWTLIATFRYSLRDSYSNIYLFKAKIKEILEMLKHQFYSSCPPGWCLCSLPLVSNLPFDPLDTKAQPDFEEWQAVGSLKPSREVQASPFPPGTRRAGEFPFCPALLPSCRDASPGAGCCIALMPSWPKTPPALTACGGRNCVCSQTALWREHQSVSAWICTGKIGEAQGTLKCSPFVVVQTLLSENTSLAAADFPLVILKGRRGAGEQGDPHVQLLLSFRCSFK